jgi:ribonuclease P protein component
LLAASERLRKTSVFQRAYAAKNSVNSGCVTLYVLLKRSKESHNRASNQNQKNQEKHLLPRRPDQKAGSSNLPGQAPTPDNQHKGPDKETVTGSTQANRWPSNSFPLVGFSISKKVLKSACKRNRAKRRVREAYRRIRKAADPQVVAQIRMERFYSLVFVINPSVLTARFEDVSNAVRDSLIKATTKFSHKS